MLDGPALVLLLSPTQRQSGELFRKLLDLYRDLDQPVAAVKETILTLELCNGSRVVSLPGTEGTIRGYSGAALLVIDESSRVPDGLYRAVRPMLAVSGGKLICLSTPFGKRGWWFEAWQSGQEWERIEVPASKCPRISRKFLLEEETALGPLWYNQEYFCQFNEDGDSIFSHESILAACDDSLAPLPLIVEMGR